MGTHRRNFERLVASRKCAPEDIGSVDAPIGSLAAPMVDPGDAIRRRVRRMPEPANDRHAGNSQN